jgi:hypothetical protein
MIENHEVINDCPSPSETRSGVIQRPVSPKDWVAGEVSGLPDEILQEDGNWLPFKSDPHELQVRFGKDFGNCTKFALSDAIEAYMFRKFGVRVNYNERAMSVMSGQTGYGDSLYNSLEGVRKFGLVPENIHPWKAEHDTEAKYYSATDEEKADWKEHGDKWLERYSFGYEWVYADFNGGFEKALKSSPIYTAGLFAYEASVKDGVFTSELPYDSKIWDNTPHAFVAMHYEPDGHKNIDDSYATQIKRCAPNYRFPLGARIYIEEKKPMTIAEKYNLKDDDLIQMTEKINPVTGEVYPDSGQVALFLSGHKLIMDDKGIDKLLRTHLVRKYGRGLTKEAWDEIPTRIA